MQAARTRNNRKELLIGPNTFENHISRYKLYEVSRICFRLLPLGRLSEEEKVIEYDSIF